MSTVSLQTKHSTCRQIKPNLVVVNDLNTFVRVTTRILNIITRVTTPSVDKNSATGDKNSATSRFSRYSAYNTLIFHSTWPLHTYVIMCQRQTGIRVRVTTNRRFVVVLSLQNDLQCHQPASKTYLSRRHLAHGTNTTINNFACPRLVSAWALSLLTGALQPFYFL